MPELFESILIPYVINYEAVPTIIGWNRLEGRARKDDFARSLKAEVRDPLWMLTRQWQLGEFDGEDAASPVKAQLVAYHTELNRYAPVQQAASGFDKNIPLEVRAESERVRFTLELRIRAGIHFSRLLQAKGLSSAGIDKVHEWFPLEVAAASDTENNIQSHAASAQLYDHANRHNTDGESVLREINSGQFNTRVDADGVLTADEKTKMKEAAQQLKNWFGRLYTQPSSGESEAWVQPALEYQFKVSADSRGAQVVYKADQFADGALDWYSFDVEKNARLNDGTGISPSQERSEVIEFIPSPIQFGGMPNIRYWEMEDRRTDFGGINMNTTDLPQLLYAEFGMIYSNDWFIIPFDMNAGTIADVKGIVVTDVFGERTLIRAAGTHPSEAWQKWDMYRSSIDRNENETAKSLLMLPVVTKSLESEPLETVKLIRDEMANMVWAVEAVIPAEIGKGINGYDAATALENYLGRTTVPPVIDREAPLHYVLGTAVPRNWIPFIAVHEGTSDRSVQLQLASMPERDGPGFSTIKPRGLLLEHDDAEPLFINEEEVGRAGVTVTRNFQRTRWYSGKTYLWMSRKVAAGRGEGSSGLVFDQLDVESNA